MPTSTCRPRCGPRPGSISESSGWSVIFALLGLLSRRLDVGFGAGALSAGSVGYLGVSIFSGYMFILLRGSLLQSMGRLLILALAIAVLSVSRQTKAR